jgi:hypothetical protein
VNFYAYVGNDPVDANDPTGQAKIPGVDAAKTVLTAKAAELSLRSLRRRAVSDAWAMERRLVEKADAQYWTRNWSPDEVKELLSSGKVTGYQGHHIKNVRDYPALAGDQRNITFLKEGAEHIGAHGGNYRNTSSGELLDRTAGGTLEPLTLQSGRTIYDLGAVILGGAATVLGVIDALEPTQYLTSPSSIPEGATPGPWWCFGCYEMPKLPVGPQSLGNPATGGFVLYPNKSNVNRSRFVYSK